MAGAARASVGAVGRSGTSLPGLVAERVDPTILEELAEGLTPIVLVVGTNGKTTTARLVVRILAATRGTPPISNASGANLRQGVIAALLRQGSDSRQAANAGDAATDDAGGNRTKRRERGAVLEVDELALPSVAAAVHPDVIVMTNLFRDQLDRYGETDRVMTTWRAVLATVPRSTRLVVCSEDARLEDLAAESGLTTLRFGAEPMQTPTRKPTTGLQADAADRIDPSTAATIDPVGCRACGEP
ncbi:MAG TPA: Mur ligase family protein, partial [Candidatus Limnocylindrales bacterium]|nr:Mur ligase family protein [Candidatus Limnocylindrales bacterium]